ncbi:Cytochrome c oxidase subunit 6B [Lasiodiplodia hormozganensis]|uniref:Cytochrome c oxidase subunit 12, mitochondrial n=1 Tax=Lasiodiplodia hormozganensis TaxID=869390 RepID=A0AA39Z0H5_9PEZI|nr:Cytochrome c oxidase subunit 6B [Lasiodiplodia hormozganensis]
MSDSDDRETKPFKFVTAHYLQLVRHPRTKFPGAHGPLLSPVLLPAAPQTAHWNDGVEEVPSDRPLLALAKARMIRICSRRIATGFDARFPNQNQTKHCWQNYVDYHKCILAKGEDFAPCRQFLLAYRSLCPSGWVERWNDQREAGTFPVRLDQ